MTRLKRIALLSTGGTIASIPGKEGRAVAGALPGSALVAHLGLPDHIQLHVENVFQKSSNFIGPAEWIELANRCQALMSSKAVDGIVVTHGTDTLEDTAYYMHSVLDTSDIPVVVTGSQRTPHALGTDAHSNVRDALQLAACEHARGLGVLVCFNQSVYSAGFTRKVSSYQLHGFAAPGYGALGMLDDGHFHLLQRPVLQTLLASPDSLPRVDILPVYGGADVAMAQAVMQSGPVGVVVDGLGRGQVPPGWMPAIRRALESGLIIAVCSSTLHGATHESYEYPGSLHELVEAGAVPVSHLSARKVRIRLSLCLAHGMQDRTSILAAFDWRLS